MISPRRGIAPPGKTPGVEAAPTPAAQVPDQLPAGVSSTDSRSPGASATAVALLSDIHGNRLALEAVLADATRRGITRFYCLGDLVGYGPDPNGVIDLIRDRGIPTILGNYDDGVGRQTGDCGCYYSTQQAAKLGAASYAFTSAIVTPDRKEFLRGLPRERRIEVGTTRVHLVHGSPRRINEYLLEDRDERTFVRLAAAEEGDALAFGHTHEQWHREYAGVLFVAVGSVGKPKDGDPRAMYTAVVGPAGPRAAGQAAAVPPRPPAEPPATTRQIEIEAVRVVYDVEETARAIVVSGLPEALAEALRAGT